MSEKQNAVAKIVSIFICIFILVAAVGIIAKFTNGFQKDFTTFYLARDGEKILRDQSGYVMNETGWRFEVGNVLKGKDKAVEYRIAVVPQVTEETDFVFSDASGKKYKYSCIKDLTKGFEIEKEKNVFTIKASGELTKVLSKYYKDMPLSGVPNDGKEYCCLIVTSAEDGTAIRIGFGFEITLTGIVLKPETLVF